MVATGLSDPQVIVKKFETWFIEQPELRNHAKTNQAPPRHFQT